MYIDEDYEDNEWKISTTWDLHSVVRILTAHTNVIQS